jgi:hypothetical protein
MERGKLNEKGLSGAAAALSEFRIPVTRRGKKTARPVRVGLSEKPRWKACGRAFSGG